MSGRYLIVAVAGLAVMLSAAAWVRATLELRSARQEVTAVTQANDFLKKTLGEMTVAIASKEKEIDRLQRSACNGQEKSAPSAPKPAARNKAAASAAAGSAAGELFR